MKKPIKQQYDGHSYKLLQDSVIYYNPMINGVIASLDKE